MNVLLQITCYCLIMYEEQERLYEKREENLFKKHVYDWLSYHLP